jgi:hypothetical protein
MSRISADAMSENASGVNTSRARPSEHHRHRYIVEDYYSYSLTISGVFADDIASMLVKSGSLVD